MLFGIDPSAIRFEAPQLLLLLGVPATLLVLWMRLLSLRRRDRRTLVSRRVVPERERISLSGDLPLWLGLILSSASLVLAMARPQTVVSRVRTAGIDLVVLADASASMYVEDVAGSRWHRSMDFLSVLGNALRWKDDRIAMAIFANIAAPQVRLTTDPNAFFFFLHHLSAKPPFRLEDDQTWDTNVEQGIHWGLRLITKDAELNGRSQNAPAFVLISDGQVWSGEVRNSLDSARARGIPVYVIGVGTALGGPIPEPKPKATAFQSHEHESTPPTAPVRSSLNRTSLRTIATAGQGLYFELDRAADREIANSIIDAARRQSASSPLEERHEDLYWPFLLFSAALAALGAVWLRERAELWLGAAVALATMGSLWSLLR